MTQFSAKVHKPYLCPFLGPFCPKSSREREFSQIWGLRGRLANHNALHFRSFLVKTNDSILGKKSIFGPLFLFLCPFWPKSREREFSQIWDFRRKLANHNTLNFRSFLAKTNDSILHKSPITLLLGLFVVFFPIFGQMRIFLKNRALSLFYIYGPLPSLKISEKSNESILRTLRHRQTDDTEFIGPSRLKCGSKN